MENEDVNLNMLNLTCLLILSLSSASSSLLKVFGVFSYNLSCFTLFLKDWKFLNSVNSIICYFENRQDDLKMCKSDITDIIMYIQKIIKWMSIL